MDSEASIEAYLRNKVKRCGGRCYKWVSPGNSGVPDRIVVLPEGVLVFVELKNEKGRLSELQKVQLARLESLGQRTEVINSKKGVDEFMKDLGFSRY